MSCVSTARAALSTPARDPIGDGITDDTDAIQARIDRRPQPAADVGTRVVRTVLLEVCRDVLWKQGYYEHGDELSVIIEGK